MGKKIIKQQLLLFIFMLLYGVTPMHAADNLITQQVNILVDEPGNLKNLITNEQVKRFTNIKLTGKLNVEDIKFIRKMVIYEVLQHLDISDVQFVGTGTFSVGYKKANFTDDAVGEYLFARLDNLKSIVLPSYISTIREHAFYECKGLTALTLPDGVTSVGDSAFFGCSGLTSLTLPDGLTSVGDTAFSGCSGLTSLTLPESLTSIGDWAFSGCNGLTSLTLPDGLASVGNGAFFGCSGLTSLTLPDGLT